MKLWDFCEQFYGDKRIELLCLDLQNRYQANVGLMLWLCWLARIDRFVNQNVFDQAKSLSDSFHDNYIILIRNLRKNAKIGALNHGQFISQYLLSAEILLERELLESFETLYAGSYQSAPDESTYGLADYLRACNVADYDSAAQFLYAGARSICSV